MVVAHRDKIALIACVVAVASGLLAVYHRNRDMPREESVQESSEPVASSNDGELLFSDPDVDLGLIRRPATHHFEFVNRGSQDVRILGTKTTCACAVTKPEKEIIKPNENGRISVNVTPRADRRGPQRYTIDVEYESGLKRVSQLTVRALYHSNLVFPKEMSLRSVVGNHCKDSFHVWDFREHPLEITRVIGSASDLTATVVEKPTNYLPGWRYRIEVSLADSPRAIGLSTETIQLQTTDPENELIEIPVTIRRITRIHVAPSTLRLRSGGADNDNVEGLISIGDANGEPVEIKSVTTSSEAIQCTYSTLPESRPLVRVTLARPLEPAESPAKVHISIVRPIVERATMTVHGR
jgi:hypothetical protein